MLRRSFKLLFYPCYVDYLFDRFINVSDFCYYIVNSYYLADCFINVTDLDSI